MNQQTSVGRRPAPPTHRACPRPSTGPPSRPSWTAAGPGEGAHPGRRRDRRGPAAPADGRGGRQPPLTGPHGPLTLLDAFEGRRQLIAYYFMWHPGHPAAEQCEGCTWVTTQVAELSYLHSRDITYAVFCQGPYDESIRYHDFMGWDMPWYSAQASLDALLVGRQIGLFHLVCYLRDGDRVFETYWTTRRGVEAMDYSYALMDLTVYGRQEPWEDSPPGWPQQCSITRTDGGSPDWPPVSVWPGGRPIAQWSAPRSRTL
jgi:hypothetical protein